MPCRSGFRLVQATHGQGIAWRQPFFMATAAPAEAERDDWEQNQTQGMHERSLRREKTGVADTLESLIPDA